MTYATVRDPLMRARATRGAYEISQNIFVLGSFESGVTVYNQQVRAHNLVWALWECAKAGEFAAQSFAVIGGGISGLTVAGAIASLFPGASVKIFEKRWDLCPLQLGCDTRWLHPKLYEWPAPGSRAPSASLPVLTWNEGRASDVARQIIRRFGKYTTAYPDRISTYIGVKHLKIDGTRSIDWMGHTTVDNNSFYRVAEGYGASEQFDAIVLSSGFGLERGHTLSDAPSYWRNEQIGQPILNGSRQAYLVSGYGDGALVDLFRLTIERFRQDTILYELFDEIETFEGDLIARFEASGVSYESNLFDIFNSVSRTLLNEAIRRLSLRLRKDSTVTLHASGRNSNTSFRTLFNPNASVLNRMILYLLYRCGGFSLSFDELPDAIEDGEVPKRNVLCRHGADTKKHVMELFSDPASVEGRLDVVAKAKAQYPRRLWIPGCFPPPGS